MREIPKDLQVYKHFKGSLYQIVTIAIHTETTEKMVIYRSLKNPERVFARPLDMFLSEVNHKKYPDVKAKYRFTLLDEVESEEPAEEDTTTEEVVNEKVPEESFSEPVLEENNEQVIDSDTDTSEEKEDTSDDDKIYKEDGTLVIDPYVEKILDSKEYSDKIEAFEMLRGKCDEDMLSTLAMSLDIQLSGDTLEEKYADILKCLKMHQKYETNRLR
ncbi:MAG: DUF1653 domain-containing protein [Lachnospiraceae bacterium]|nr:DUF1653 domain-containing protein [Lachnospiraceae bacterium]